MTDEQLARAMFTAYNDQGPSAWHTFDGRRVPSWDELNDQVRGKWGAAAARAREIFASSKPDKTIATPADPGINDCG